jgi:peroxiredoxin Q/BCP
MRPKPGDRAPDFSARSSDGRDIRLSDYRGAKRVVLFFYPKDFTPGCTAEACSFRDAYDELVAKDTEVLGVSLDSDTSHAEFASRHRLPFPLLSDPEGRIARQYGALGGLQALLGVAKRITFVIDREGIVRAVIHHELRVGRHLQEVRAALES